MPQQVKIFAGNASHELGEKIAAAYGTQLGDLSLQRFADTELGPSFNESVRGCAVFLSKHVSARRQPDGAHADGGRGQARLGCFGHHRHALLRLRPSGSLLIFLRSPLLPN